MPSRNVIKIDIPDTFYHVYARGHGRQHIYRDDEDYRVFLNLFKRYLDVEAHNDASGRSYAHLRGMIELNCYCLMPNHFHLLLYQKDETAMAHLMRAVITSYSRYFNTKYHSSGAVFESTYKASMVTSDVYLQHISRYIHLNPKQWKEYAYSSLPFYLGVAAPEWVQPARITELFVSADKYEEFMADYEDYKLSLDSIKHELANSIN